MRRDVRILGRIEKAVLALIAGFVFMGVATILTPGVQTIVAGVACPAGTTGSAVVRYPHVVEPADMVRNTPLVCLVDGRAELASHAKVLPALFVVGLVASIPVIVAVAAVVRLARRGGDPTVPRRPRTAFEGVRFLPLLISTQFVFMAVYGLYWWLAVDTPYRVESCRGSSGGSATCYDGEPMYRTSALGFGAIALIGVAIWLIGVGRTLRRDRRFARAWATGVRAPATLRSAEATSTKVNGGRIHRFTYEVQPVDGSPPFTFVQKGRWSDTNAGGVGRVVEAIYDPEDRSSVFLVPPGSVPRPPAATTASSGVAPAQAPETAGPPDPQAPVVTW